MRRVPSLILLLTFFLGFQAKQAFAKPPTGFKKIPFEQVLSVFTIKVDKKSVKCGALTSGKFVAGEWQRHDQKEGFVRIKNVIKQLESRIPNTFGKQRSRLSRKLKTLKDSMKKRNRACKKEGKTTFSPTPTPTPTPDYLAQVKVTSQEDLEKKIRHLYSKAGLGAVPQQAYSLGNAGGIPAVVTDLMTYRPEPDLEVEAADALDGWFNFVSVYGTSAKGINLWALHLMLKTENPFFERHAFLFLHNLLATSSFVLNDFNQLPLMVDHLNKVRAGAISGDYRLLLKDIARDEVMLKWLNSSGSTAKEPNENFARELHELFTVGPYNPLTGEENYSELDIAIAAKACAGLFLHNDTSTGIYDWVTQIIAENVDPADNSIYNGRPFESILKANPQRPEPQDLQLIDALFDKHPGTADYLSYRLAKEYVKEDPEKEYVAALSKVLRESNFNFNVALERLFNSQWFYDNEDTIITSPSERLISFVRQTYMSKAMDAFSMHTELLNTGHIISMPPTVFGWKNPEWANAAWQLIVTNHINGLSTWNGWHPTIPSRKWNHSEVFPPSILNPTPEELIDHLLKLLNVDITAEERANYVYYLNNDFIYDGSGMIVALPKPFNASDQYLTHTKVGGLLTMLANHLDSFTR